MDAGQPGEGRAVATQIVVSLTWAGVLTHTTGKITLVKAEGGQTTNKVLDPLQGPPPTRLRLPWSLQTVLPAVCWLLHQQCPPIFLGKIFCQEGLQAKKDSIGPSELSISQGGSPEPHHSQGEPLAHYRPAT